VYIIQIYSFPYTSFIKPYTQEIIILFIPIFAALNICITIKQQEVYMKKFLEKHEDWVYGGAYLIFLLLYFALVIYLCYKEYEFPEVL
jgi:hypothetical protein